MSSHTSQPSPRTRHLNADGTPRYTNRLVNEPSPYLQQHAHNPVDWYPWGEEALRVARQHNRPIFLSIGYSTCHWCHVMEEESFEDEEIARYLGDHYVCIKVDREERPDLDASYMAFVQALTGRGGWPMSVWLTPSCEPFFGGTYFPPRVGARGARAGFAELLRYQAERFARDPAGVAREAAGYATRLAALTAPEPAGEFPGVEVLAHAVERASLLYDPVAGGARGAPKFPATFPVQLLLRVARRTDDARALKMAVTTLTHMRAGGLYDQLAGGFHRYSTDEQWLVPHFEKMLYDNALLAAVYLEASRATGDGRHAGTTREVLDYVLRELTSPEGGFYSATDADSLSNDGRREEGLYFTWTPAELVAELGAADAAQACVTYGVTNQGHVDGRSVLHLQSELSPSQYARELRAKLLAARSKRPAPLRDDKIIVAWNALTLSALARAATILGEPRYASAAVRCAELLLGAARTSNGLPHMLVGGVPYGRAFADDTAMLAAAFLDVFELTSELRWLDGAVGLMEALQRDFVDAANGGYFLSAAHHEALIVRDKPDYDGAIPSAGSAAALTWLRLWTLTGDELYRARAEATLRSASRRLAGSPLALEQMLLALDWATDAAFEVVVVVPEGRGALLASARPLVDVMARCFVPNAVLLVASQAELEGELGARVPWARGKRALDGVATAYVCERGTCLVPTRDPEELAAQLARARPYPSLSEGPEL